MNDWWKIAFGVLCGLLGAGLIILVSGQTGGEAILLRPPPTPAPILVHVDGAVLRPGIYSLSAGSRVTDALQAAGGALPSADTSRVNLAGPLQDGALVLVATQPPAGSPAETLPPANERSQAIDLAGLININTATLDELDQLPGIGPVTAGKIIQYREANGYFPNIEDILNVPGIGDKTFEDIRSLITVEP